MMDWRIKMNDNVKILIAEDDEGHAKLIEINLRRSGIVNEIIMFNDGEEVIKYLLKSKALKYGHPYLLLLDIRMPKMDGIEVLKQIKNDPHLKKMPVIMITTTDDPREIDACHLYGCNSYITKPVEYDKFTDAIRNLGAFLKIVKIPEIDGMLAVKANQT